MLLNVFWSISNMIGCFGELWQRDVFACLVLHRLDTLCEIVFKNLSVFQFSSQIIAFLTYQRLCFVIWIIIWCE